jgi:hypothetical protein
MPVAVIRSASSFCRRKDWSRRFLEPLDPATACRIMISRHPAAGGAAQRLISDSKPRMCRWLQPGIRRPVIVALHSSLGKLGQQGSNLNVLLNNVLNILNVNQGPEGSPRHALQRAKGPKRRWTHDFALGPKPSWGIFGGDSWTLDSRALASVK